MKGSEAVYGVEPNRRNRGLGDDGSEASPSAVAPCGHERALDRQSGAIRVQRAQECVLKIMCVRTVDCDRVSVSTSTPFPSKDEELRLAQSSCELL